MQTDFSTDVAAIASIDAVPTILDVVCRSTGMGFAAVARVTEDRWVACGVRDEIAFGLQPGGELKVETTICNEIRDHREPVVIDNVAEHPVYRLHHTPAIYGLQSYISVPIILSDGRFFGTLCAIDPKPRKLDTPETIGMFKLFADLIAFHLDAHSKVASSQALLATEVLAGELREQFIAVLGHDLRNPLASLEAGLRMIARDELPEKSMRLVGLMRQSIARMTDLISDILDFARGRLGGGIVLDRRSGTELRPALEHVVGELRSAHPDVAIESDIGLSSKVDADQARIAQMLSNLLANAIAHGRSDKPIRVSARETANVFELSVTNAGEPIAPTIMEGLFRPFVRAVARSNQDGLGLGLYICSEIAKSHGGTLDVRSDATETRFTFRMPL